MVENLRVCIVQADYPGPTFVRAHAERLPAEVTVVHGIVPHIGPSPLLSQTLPAKAFRKARRSLLGRDWTWELTWGYLRAFRRRRPHAVLAEFGPAAVGVMDACRLAGLPLVAHFHGGYDVASHDIRREHSATYSALFKQAAAIIAVSKSMESDLIAWGARPEQIYCLPCGVDSAIFSGGNPCLSSPVFVAIGQFIDFKAPHLTVLAFEKVLRAYPSARLRMTGDGQLLPVCRELVRALRIEHAVRFLGKQSHERVREELRCARAFVQHSLVASSGNREGTPVAVIEACMTGIPVVATRHEGIPDVIEDGVNGFLVDECDVEGMADRMLRLARDPELAAGLGSAGRQHAVLRFDQASSVRSLGKIIQSTLPRRQAESVKLLGTSSARSEA